MDLRYAHHTDHRSRGTGIDERDERGTSAGEQIRRLELLLAVSDAVGDVLDLRALERIAHVIVPSIADACAIDLLEKDGRAWRVVAVASDEERQELIDRLTDSLPTLIAHPAVAAAVREGKAILQPTLDEAETLADIGDAEHADIIRSLGIRSGMIVPMRGRTGTVGVITVGRGDESSPFDEADVDLIEEVARQAALAAENAMLFRDIRAAHHRYRVLLESMDAVAWEATPDPFRLTYIGEQAEKLLGHGPDRFLAEPDLWISLIHPDDRAWVTERMLDAARAREDHEMEYRVLSDDGRVVWLHSRVFGSSDNEMPAVLRGLWIDITERKRAEARQRAQLATTRVFAEAETPIEIPARILHALLESLGWSAGALWLVDHGRNVLRCTEFVAMPGVHIPLFEGATWRTEFTLGVGLPGRVFGSRQPVWVEDISTDTNFPRAPEAQRSGLRGAFAFPILAEGRVQGVLEFFSGEVRRPDEGVMQLVGAVGVQMGQFIRRRALEEDLRGSESRTRAVMDSSLDAIVTMDDAGRIVTFNPSAVEMFGHEAEDVIGRELADVLIPPSLRDAHRSALARYLETGHGAIIGKRIEMPAMRADGTEFPVELGIAARVERGEILFIGFIRDLTLQRTAEQRRTALHAITRVLAEADTLATATARIVETVCRTLDWQVGILWSLDQALDRMRFVEGWHAPDGPGRTFVVHCRTIRFAHDEGVVGRAWATRHPVWVGDVEDEPLFVRSHVAARQGLRSVLGIPVIGTSRVLGVIEFYSDDIREPDDDLLRMMSGVGIQLGTYIERKMAQEESAFQRTLLSSQSEASIDGILVVDHEGHALSYNQRFLEMWEITEQEVADADVLEELLVHVADPDGARGELQPIREDPDRADHGEVVLRDGRTFDRYTAPVVADDGTNHGRLWVFRDISEQKRTERALQESTARSAFLAEVSSAIVGSIDPEAMLRDLATLSVPTFADWCAVDLLREDDDLERVALVHRDEAAARAIEELRVRAGEPRLDPHAARGVSAVIHTGQPELEPEVPDAWLEEAARGHLDLLEELRKLRLRSYICVPLTTSEGTIGAITFATTGAGRSYGTADLWLAEDLSHRVTMAFEYAKLYAQTDHVAKALQESLIPPELPTIPGVEAAARFRPGGEGSAVGGDFYDLFNTGRNDWAIVMGDVCGKGADAAAVTALARYTIRASAMQTRRPSFILTQLNAALQRQRSDDRFCTVSYARLRRHRGIVRLTTTSAGHPSPLIVRTDGSVEKAGRSGIILGAFDEVELGEQTVRLDEGDLVVFYTDGVTEAGAPAEMLDEEGLIRILRRAAGATADEAADLLEREALARSAGGHQRDDIAIVVLRIGGVATAEEGYIPS